MKYAAVFLAIAGLAAAQNINSIPACAQPCINAAVTNATTCAVSDYVCICKDETALIGAATSCVIQNCGTTVATNQVLPATEQFCSQVLAGGTVTSGPTGSATGAGSSSATGSSPASTSASVSSAANSTSSAASTTSAPSTTSAASSASSSSASAVSTAGAAIVGSVGSLAMLALGAMAAL